MNNESDIRSRCKDYRSHIKKAVQFLSKHNVVNKNCPEMYGSCQTMLSSLAVTPKKNNPWRVEISQAWRIPVTKNKLCGAQGDSSLIITGYINTKNGKLQDQSISVSLILNPNKNQKEVNGYDSGKLVKNVPVVVRRFHFDYDLGIDENDRPRSHIQYGGKFEKDRIGIDNLQYRLFSSLETPRIPCPPYDLVLVVDLFLHQYETPLDQIKQEPEWQRLVKESEELWTKGYYCVLTNHLNSTGATESLYKRQCSHVDWIGTG